MMISFPLEGRFQIDQRAAASHVDKSGRLSAIPLCKIVGSENVLSRVGRRSQLIPEGGAVVEITKRTVGRAT